MKNIKRILAGFLVVAMAASTVACGGRDNSSSTATTTKKQADTTTVAATEATTVATTEAAKVFDKDLEGYEYIISCFYGSGVWHPAEGESEIGDLMLERYSQIEEENNCKISFIDCNTDEFIDAVNVSAATGTKYADQLHLNVDMYGKLTRAGYLAPMSEIPSIDVKDEKWNQYYFDMATSIDGKVYGLDFLSWPNRKPYPDQCMFFNRTILEEFGMEDPYELYKNGEWTWEKFRELLKDGTRDTNGDGEMDVYGLTCVGELLEYAALGSNGAKAVEIVDGKYKYTLDNDAAYKALQYTSDIRNVDKTFKGFAPGEHWGLPLDTFKAGGTVFFTRDVICYDILKETDYKIGMVPFPKGPDMKGAYPTATWNGDVQVQGILKSGNDVEKAGYIFNRITEPFEEYAMGEWKDYALRNHFQKDQFAFDIFMEMNQNAVTDGFSIYGDAFNKLSTALNEAANLVKTPAEALGDVKEELQAHLDDTMNK